MISKETAIDIAMAHHEIETAEKLLEEIQSSIKNYQEPDIRDAFGRVRHGLELGVPSGESSKRLFNVPWRLAKPVIEVHIASCRSQLMALNEKARHEAATE